MNKLYPLKFNPVFKEKIWGGERIRTRMGLDFSPLPNCGEAWVLSGVKSSTTRVSNGFLKGNDLNELLEVFMDDLVGEKAFETDRKEFPILIKFIDANDYLSIQVHPDDELAARRRIGHGKSEMWYILDADPEAILFSGFNREMDRSTYLRYFEQKRLKEILNVEKVVAGDAFYIPAGRIHALGPGILLAEIQQTSDTTYRIYDWDRVDSGGNSRELHTDLALDAIDFTRAESYRSEYRKISDKTVTMVDSPYFTANVLDLEKSAEKDYTYRDSFIIYLCVSGGSEIRYGKEKIPLSLGEAMLIPAEMESVTLVPKPFCTILEVYLP